MVYCREDIAAHVVTKTARGMYLLVSLHVVIQVLGYDMMCSMVCCREQGTLQ